HGAQSRRHQPRPEPGRGGRCENRRPAVLARLLDRVRRMAHHRGGEPHQPLVPGIGALPAVRASGAGAHPQARRAQPVFGGLERRGRSECAGRHPAPAAGAGDADRDSLQRAVGRQLPLAARDGQLDQPRGDKVPVDGRAGFDAHRVQSGGRNAIAQWSVLFLHRRAAGRPRPV
ncbi:hypothetical protein LTR94_027395, partial [Friedmanniomyces endolithicus]